MARFSGIVGFVESVETIPSIFEDKVTEVRCSGNFLDNTQRWEQNEGLNDDIDVTARLSVVVGPDLLDKFYLMRYVHLYGKRWEIKKSIQKRPRVIITVGGIYNGPTPIET